MIRRLKSHQSTRLGLVLSTYCVGPSTNENFDDQDHHEHRELKSVALRNRTDLHCALGAGAHLCRRATDVNYRESM